MIKDNPILSFPMENKALAAAGRSREPAESTPCLDWLSLHIV